MTRISCLSGLAGLILLLPGAACGQAPQQPQPMSVQPGQPRAAMTQQQFAARRERRILSADTDGDGKVSRDEFLASARAGKGDPARRFARLDRNRDGVVDRQEIAATMARRFARLDTNRDGELTPAERTAARAKTKRSGAES